MYLPTCLFFQMRNKTSHHQREPNILAGKKTRRDHLWKRNLARKNRNEGKAYVDRKGQQHGERRVRECIHQCRFQCNVNFVEEQRQDVFKHYWELGNWDLQSSYLNSCLTVEEPARKKKEGKGSKSLSCQYQLLGKRVCKQFFLSTLDVSNKRITNVINKKKIPPQVFLLEITEDVDFLETNFVMQKLNVQKSTSNLFPNTVATTPVPKHLIGNT